MISNLNSETNIVSQRKSGERSISRERGGWTVRGTGGKAHVASQVSAGNLNLCGNVAYRPAFRITPSGSSGSVIADDNLDHVPVKIAGALFGSYYPHPLDQVHDLTLVVKTFTSFYESYAQTTEEQLHELGKSITNSLLTIEESRTDLSQELAEVFSLAAGEHFEDGMDNRFSRALGRFIRDHKLAAVATMGRAIELNLFRESYVSEALLWIGELDDNETEIERRILLESACDSYSVSIRDSAVSGLSYLGAAESKDRLENMLTVEPVKGVRVNIEAVLAYLRE